MDTFKQDELLADDTQLIRRSLERVIQLCVKRFSRELLGL